MYRFVDVFKQTGDAQKAFVSALNAFVKYVASEMDYHYSEEALVNNATINELFFTRDGFFVGNCAQKIAA
ncbi:hypothetical protein [Ferrovum myxofaciens]|uniref:hypothetical protein n=1 Tax=Ferrovum myxofaciens TaxID=416213 RepID=UPI001AF64C4B|nr:hypothetical protein [Ferrovum myxofaciens]QSH81918.1 MAG: hypothetical protein HO273_13855 [Ferrovum myxofaciens]QWY75114.1 MAG: hypothetical protein JVY19_01300 [Ferrovum myxofaciens]